MSLQTRVKESRVNTIKLSKIPKDNENTEVSEVNAEEQCGSVCVFN